MSNNFEQSQIACAHFCSLMHILTPIMVDIGAKEIVQDGMALVFKFAIKEGIKHCQVRVSHNTSNTFKLQVENFINPQKPYIYDGMEKEDLKLALMHLFVGRKINKIKFRKEKGKIR